MLQTAAFNTVYSLRFQSACSPHYVRTMALSLTAFFKKCVTVLTVSNTEGQELDFIISWLSAQQTGRYILGQHTSQQLLS